LIVHSVHDPLKRGVHYDYDQILIMGDWYHNTSSEIVKALDSPQGYQGVRPSAPVDLRSPSVERRRPSAKLGHVQRVWDLGLQDVRIP
jgi:hypothetical protein